MTKPCVTKSSTSKRCTDLDQGHVISMYSSFYSVRKTPAIMSHIIVKSHWPLYCCAPPGLSRVWPYSAPGRFTQVQLRRLRLVTFHTATSSRWCTILMRSINVRQRELLLAITCSTSTPFSAWPRRWRQSSQQGPFSSSMQRIIYVNLQNPSLFIFFLCPKIYISEFSSLYFFSFFNDSSKMFVVERKPNHGWTVFANGWTRKHLFVLYSLCLSNVNNFSHRQIESSFAWYGWMDIGPWWHTVQGHKMMCELRTVNAYTMICECWLHVFMTDQWWYLWTLNTKISGVETYAQSKK